MKSRNTSALCKCLAVAASALVSFGLAVPVAHAQNPIDGAGTAGRVAKFSDLDTIVDSNIRENATGHVGIGANAINVLRLLVRGGFGVTANSTLGALIANQNGSGAIAEFRAGATVRSVVTNQGNIGVGTVNAPEMLTVNGNIQLDNSQSSATIGFPIVNLGGRDLTIQAGGNATSHGAATGGGNLILRAGNANISGPFGCPSPGPFNNSVKIIAGDNVFGGVCFDVHNGDIEFYAGDGQPEVMRIVGNTGNVGIGTGTPSESLSVAGNICASGSIGSCSDARFKENVETIDGALATVTRLRGVDFDWKRGEFPDRKFSDAHQVGFIAQEVKGVLPEVVTQSGDGFYSIDYGHLTPVLVEAIKEQQKQILAQQAQIEALTKAVSALQSARSETVTTSAPAAATSPR